ncbi:molecular chaperone [Alginatibacterium sediminis]|uniref:Molecular chaperone n=1 Tax=Alginatibacterium sediminis TaxID=2164068 RepID=A0A420E867_9ALTE|nr:OmpH family outer membrane protein [Alginatibacterium sediminis]RKF15504.1 molecular chaperone [Alginatibacterium sediminis]
MKKLLSAAAIALALSTTAMPALATNVGVVDVAEVFQNHPKREGIAKKLKDEFEGRAREIRALEKEMQTMLDKREKDGALMKSSDLSALNRKLESKQNDYTFKRKTFEEDNRRRQAEEQQKLMKSIQTAVTAVAKAKKLDLVIPLDATAYVKDSIDISKDVIKRVK